MRCKDAKRYLSDWVDNALPPARAGVLEQHLRSCAACDAERRRLQTLKSLVALKRYEQPEPLYLRGMLDEFHRRLAAQKSARHADHHASWYPYGLRWWWHKTRLVLARKPLVALRYGIATAAVLALLANAAVLMLRRPHTSTPAQPPSVIQVAPTYVLEQLPSDGEAASVKF